MRLSNEEWRAHLDAVKARVSIVEIATEAGLELRREGACYKALCPFHDDAATPSLALYPDEGRWRCFGACQVGGDVLDLYGRLHRTPFGETVRQLAARAGVARPDGAGGPPPRATPVARAAPPALAPPPAPAPPPALAPTPPAPARPAVGHPSRSDDVDVEEGFERAPPPDAPVDLEDLEGVWPYDRAEAVYAYPVLGGGVAHEVRYRDKNGRKCSVLCRPTAWGLVYGVRAGEYALDGKGCWRHVTERTPVDAPRKKIAAARLGLYRPAVFGRARPGGDWVFCVEGPKDAETALSLGLVATTSANGASGLQEWQAAELEGHLVAVVGDHDAAGLRGAKRRAERLRPFAREVRVLPPLGGEPGSGYDLTDWVAERRARGIADADIAAELLRLVEASAESTGKVKVIVTTHEKAVADEALAVVVRRERNLFHRGGYLIHVVRTGAEEPSEEETIRRPTGSPVLRMVQEARMREVLSDHLSFVKTSEGQGGTVERPVHPPQWASRALLARGEWRGLPRLEMVVEGPVLRADGTVLQDPGYDPRSRILYLPNAPFERVPDNPSVGQIRAALALLQEAVCDFPFREETHFSAWLSSLLTPLARAAFWGPSPLNLIDANVRGAGKSLLADVCTTILSGRPAARMSYREGDEEELRKAITSLALSGTQTVLVDNIRGQLGDGTLDRALTATTWQDRLLGGNVIVELPLQVTWYATGNNVALTADTPRRCLHIRLESLEDRPEERTGFRHPRLLDWILEQRGRLLPAALTLLRGFWAAGKPAQGLKGWGSFEHWSDVVREAIVWLGLPDPAETREDLEEGADLEGGALVQLMLGLEELLADPPLLGQGSAAEIVEALNGAPEDLYKPLRAALNELGPDLRPGQLPSPRQLGGLLRQHKGRFIAGACLTCSRKTRSGVHWKVKRRPPRAEGPYFTLPRRGDEGDFGDAVSGSQEKDPRTEGRKSATALSDIGQKCDSVQQRDEPIPLGGNRPIPCDNKELGNFRLNREIRHVPAQSHTAEDELPPI